jgi:predicted O-linked N-acetylglucosamine transferase (SPINDLY family)
MNAMKSEAELLYQRGNALAQQRRLDQAGEAYDRCLALDPSHLGALNNRALVLVHQQRWDAALQALDAILLKYPQMADAWNNRSGVLQALGRHQEALESLQRVLQLRPRDLRALYNAGITLLLLRRFDEAQAALTQVVELQPGSGDALAQLVSAALRACDWEALERLLPRVLPMVADGRVVLAPLTLLALSDDAGLQMQCAQANTRRFLAQAGLEEVEPMARGGYGHTRLRIGYLSSDFRDHPVASQIVGLLERHDRSRFEAIGFSTGRADGSRLHQRIVKACDGFHDVSGMGSAEAAALIRQQEVDVLVDLNGQSLGWRPAILKYRPAPVIATFLGYAGTTGSHFIDYIIGDPQVTPFSHAPAFSEKIVQLPHSFWPSDPDLPEPDAVSRAQAGLPAEGFVFCCFNSNHKIRPDIFDIWARLLNAAPGSVLWLREGQPAMNARFRRQIEARGVEPGRLLFAGRLDSFARHLGRQVLADLFLDTFPYNAHATASDALWAGLPIVTLRGESFVTRVTASFLANLGLDELIADTPEDYERIALSLARDSFRLRDLRRRLVEARKTSPLFDAERFARAIEAAYLEMHHRVRLGLEPEGFRIGNLSQGTLNN